MILPEHMPVKDAAANEIAFALAEEPMGTCTTPHNGLRALHCPSAPPTQTAQKIDGRHEESTGAMVRAEQPGENCALRCKKTNKSTQKTLKTGQTKKFGMKTEKSNTLCTTPAQQAQRAKKKPKRKPHCHYEQGNYRLPIYRREYHGRKNNQAAYILVFKHAVTGHRAQITRVDLDELNREAGLLIARGFVTPEPGGAPPKFALDSARKYDGLRTAAAAAKSTPEELLAEALEVRRILGPHSPVVAARHYKSAMLGGYTPTRVGVVVQKYIAENKLFRRGTEYIRTMRYLLPRFARYFRGRIFDDIKANEIYEFFKSLSLHGESLRAYRGLIKTMSKFAVMQGFLPQGIKPQIFHVIFSRYQRKQVEIIQPGELRQFLDHAFDLNLILFLVLCAFGGLRTCEFERLTWNKFKEEFIHLDLSAVKSGTQERYVPILDVLRAWLKPFLGKFEGQVCSKLSFNFQVKELALVLGIKVKRNWLRHGFASYRVAILQNAPQTSGEMGNSHFVFHRHYFSAQYKALAEEFFGLMPPADWDTRWEEILQERKVAFKSAKLAKTIQQPEPATI